MKIKNAARTVIVDNDGFVALVDVRNGEYYKIPGGGIEEGETELVAAVREAREESGCDVEIVEKIGESEFVDNNPQFEKTTHKSVCFLVKKVGESGQTTFDDWEKSNQMKLIWVTFDEAFSLFENVRTNDFFGQEINKRDYEFVKKAKEMLSK